MGPLREVLFLMMANWKIYSITATLSKNYKISPERKWVVGGGIEIPCMALNYLFEARKLS